MPLNFEKYAAKGNEFVNLLMKELNTEDRDHAGRILRSVFRALRNRLTVAESIQLLAQLPMSLKAFYVDGWKFQQSKNRIKSMEDFAIEVMAEDGKASWRDFSNVDEATTSIKSVLRTLSKYVSPGEMNDMMDVLPQPLQQELKAEVLVNIESLQRTN